MVSNVVTGSNYPIWVEYWDPSEKHGHLLLLKNNDEAITVRALLVDIEEYADELASLFEQCNEDRHDGRVHKHDTDVVKRAYEAAAFQLLTTDYPAEWEEIQRKQRVFRKWGNKQAPAMVLQPAIDNPNQWHAMIPDKEGNPTLYGVRKGILDTILEDPRASSEPNKYGVGWTVRRDKN